MIINNYESAVFVSYAWGGESERIVGELERAFAERGIHIVRDKKDLDYKGSIQAFEQRIGQGQRIILIISDKYLRSEHCMYELVEVKKNLGLRERIFPIVLADARIYKANDRLNYIKYWDEQVAQLNQTIKQVEIMTNMDGITADLNKYASIRASFDHLTNLLKDMNTLTPEMHATNGFSTLISAVVECAIANKQFDITAAEQPTVTTSATVLQEWTLMQKKAVVDSLLACPSMSSGQKRDGVVSQLSTNIRNAIDRSDSGRADATNILVTCLNYTGGLANLIIAIEFYDDNAVPVQQLKQNLSNMGAL